MAWRALRSQSQSLETQNGRNAGVRSSSTGRPSTSQRGTTRWFFKPHQEAGSVLRVPVLASQVASSPRMILRTAEAAA